jgi:cell wall-associated NlpC family hydrolase
VGLVGLERVARDPLRGPARFVAHRLIVANASLPCASRRPVKGGLGRSDVQLMRTRTPLIAALVLGVVAVAAVLAAGAGSRTGSEDRAAAPRETVLTPEAAAQARKEHAAEARAGRSRAQVVQLESPGGAPPAEDASARDDAPSPGVASDAEVRAELREARKQLSSFRSYLAGGAFLQEGPRARVMGGGMAVAPENAPDVVKQVILAGNQIARFPYKWGGGHGAWRDSGYDCSGSVSFALAGAGLLDAPLTSGGLAGYGRAGPGRWITIYANGGHVFMVVAGLRFDTSGQGRAGTRWQPAQRPTGGFAVRHPPGL